MLSVKGTNVILVLIASLGIVACGFVYFLCSIISSCVFKVCV